MGMSGGPLHVGLCAACVWVRTTGNRRGSVFYLCGRHQLDPTFRKYPPLPVLQCRGFEAPEDDEGSESGHDSPEEIDS